MVDLSTIDGFDWNEANLLKNWEKHQVSQTECEEVFFNIPLLLIDDPKHSVNEHRYFVLGQTNARRLLFVGFTIRETQIRVISARPMSRKERTTYAKANS